MFNLVETDQPACDSDVVTDKDWWRDAVIYQIYLRSFQDTTGNGIGDLGGVRDRLPYIASLGVDAIWITPFFPSPMKDFGYDVSDYRSIDPVFGTLEDFDAMITSAHKLGVKVLIDLVLSHTSDLHPWFELSRKSADNSKSNWYVWADAKPDGTSPNNWLSVFGGPAWHWDARRCQYYLHNFLPEQPDLNLHNIEVQDALLDVARFWLDRGVDGFRLDTINFYFADLELKDNPPLASEERNSSIAPAVNPYNHQKHVNSKNQPETLIFLSRLRSLLDGYGAVAMGEIGDAQHGLRLLGEYTKGSNGVQMCYAFELLADDIPTAARLEEVFEIFDKVASDGWASWAFSNHDVKRHASRWNLTTEAQKCYATLLFCLRGSVCLYQGEELGLSEADISFEDIKDPYGIKFWPEFKGRDGCRTPMVWENSNQAGGFSQGNPWLPVAPEHLQKSVEVQEKQANAILHHYRRAIAFRKEHRVLGKGDCSQVRADGNIVIFTRKLADETMLCAFNLSNDTTFFELPRNDWVPTGAELGALTDLEPKKVKLGPWQPCLALKR